VKEPRRAVDVLPGILTYAGLAAAAIATAVTHLWITGWLPAWLVPWRSWLASMHEVGGSPVEFWVAGFFALSLAARDKFASPGVHATSRLLALLSLGIAVGIVWAVPRTIPMWIAVFCALAVVWVDGPADRASSTSLARFVRQIFTEARLPGTRSRMIVCALTLAIFGQFLSGRAAGTDRGEAAQRQLVRWYHAALPRAIKALGPEAGTHRIVIFSDYQCPYCRIQVPQYRSIALGYRERGAKISFELRDFPLARECNPIANVTVHSLACDMAAAARLVRRVRPEEADSFDAWLLAQSAEVQPGDLNAQLDALGLNAEFLNSREGLLAEVKADATLGSEIGVYSTPTVFVNGVRLPSVTPLGLEALLNSLTGNAILE
jgi:hypothetical protein